MRKLLPFLLLAAASCSKESTPGGVDAATADQPTAAATVAAPNSSRTAAASSIEGSWRHTETRYNRGDGTHYWQAVPSDQQSVVTFNQGKVIPGGDPYLAPYIFYQESRPGILTFSGNNGTAQVPYMVSGSTLELTFRAREEVVERFQKQ